MKKRIIICVTCIAVVSIYVDAQSTGTTVTAPATVSESFVAIPPPPPPIPPLPPVPPSAPSIDGVDLPALPPVPPPPTPPVPPAEDIAIVCLESPGPEIVSNSGYEISIHVIKGKEMLIVKKDGKTQRIKRSTWNANRKYYEKKYGQLPPPPPLPSVEV